MNRQVFASDDFSGDRHGARRFGAHRRKGDGASSPMPEMPPRWPGTKRASVRQTRPLFHRAMPSICQGIAITSPARADGAPCRRRERCARHRHAARNAGAPLPHAGAAKLAASPRRLRRSGRSGSFDAHPASPLPAPARVAHRPKRIVFTDLLVQRVFRDAELIRRRREIAAMAIERAADVLGLGAFERRVAARSPPTRDAPARSPAHLSPPAAFPP